MRLKNTAFFLFISVIFTFILVSCAPSLKQTKDDASIHYRTGELYFKEKNYPAALEELEKAVKLEPANHEYHNLLGLTYFARRMYNDALEHFKQATVLDPNSAEARINLGAVYLELKSWDMAIAEFKAAMGNVFYRTPELAYNNMGWAYYNKGEYARAVENYKKAVELLPQYPFAFHNMGLAYEKLNKTDDAISAYKKAVELEPAYIDAYYNLGLMYLKKKEKASARAAFNKVIEAGGQSERARSAREYIELLK